MSLTYEQLVADAVDCFQLSTPVYRFVRLGDIEQVEDHTLARRFAGKPDGTFLCVEVECGGQLEQLPFPNRSARTIICLGNLVGGQGDESRDDDRVGEQFSRLLEPGGAVLLGMTQRTGGAEWHASPGLLEPLLRPLGLTVVGWAPAEPGRELIYGIGFKPPVPPNALDACQRFADRLAKRRPARLTLRDWALAMVNRIRHAMGLPQRPAIDTPGLAIHLRAGMTDPDEQPAGRDADTALGSRLDLM
jgi:SAM-dependent methyltransferase